ncbi:ABC transporter [Lacticaseibacillus casei]|uniref:ABC transporter ATP-binding protein n=2 Tax=Lacticaseibacillus zeae TaxID=57037 RepID=A0A5R8LYG0_LACZE|nr:MULTISPECIES: ABC transporter ATP-binding protein [Lacticaseibacillus]KLI74581.1 ABC transporter [Lacticaseibacillus casei]OLS05638.1 ABC transporter [Lacticaseibacillus casei]QVI32475.1 ABC transporter ATP-binding protein [Lacticaseibacillus zeae]TLF42350.1 ABC transporter ATP-binding protein [Lacticaseibacillus zeae]
MYLNVEGVSKSIKGIQVLDNISFGVPKSSGTILRGPNGSGKTMLLRAISGLIKIDSGKVFIDGKQVLFGQKLPESIGVLIETPGFINSYTGFQNLHYLASINQHVSDSAIDHYLEKMNMLKYKDVKVSKYSLGMRQRLGIVQAFMEKQRLILLDEPTNGLDISGVKLFNNLVKSAVSQGSTVLIATHDIAGIDLPSFNTIYLENGKLKAGGSRAS